MRCSTWIRYLWRQLVYPLCTQKHGGIATLPNDVIVDVLSRLPTDEVLKCRRVCRKWRALTSTRHFAELHAKRASDHPIFVAQYLPYKKRGLVNLNFLDEKVKTEKMIEKRVCTSFMKNTLDHLPVLIDSCDGLLIFEARSRDLHSKIFLCNPVTQELVTLMKPHPEGRVFGIFFHSLTKEHRLLFVRRTSGCNEYFILSLGSENWRGLGTFHHPEIWICPVLDFDKYLYFLARCGSTSCTNSIMAFNIDSEEFKSLSHPGVQCSSEQCRRPRELTKMGRDGLLFSAYCRDKIIVWVLKDQERWTWDRIYKIKLVVYPNSYLNREQIGDFEIGGHTLVRIGNIEDNETLLFWHGVGVFHCNLQTKRVRKFQFNGFNPGVENFVIMKRYKKSLKSLKDLFPAYLKFLENN